MAEDVKVDPKPEVKAPEAKTTLTKAPAAVVPDGNREKALEEVLKDALVIIEDQNLRLQRMGVRHLGATEWAEKVKALLR